MSNTRLDPAALARLKSPKGIVAQGLYKRGLRVQAKARSLCPVDTGRLRASITVEIIEKAGYLICRIGTNLSYARAVHNGTGIYGSSGVPITPKNATVLRFKPKGSTAFIFRPSSAGTKPRPFLRDALGAAR